MSATAAHIGCGMTFAIECDECNTATEERDDNDSNAIEVRASCIDCAMFLTWCLIKIQSTDEPYRYVSPSFECNFFLSFIHSFALFSFLAELQYTHQ